MEQLQVGVKPEVVVEMLFAEHLVTTTKERVQAYRYYQEQRGSYWTTEKLQQQHWEWLYAKVSLEGDLLPKSSGGGHGNNKSVVLSRCEKPYVGN